MFGGKTPSLLKSRNQRDWELVGRFMTKNMPDVHDDEDYSCSDFFRIGDKYMWLLISHNYGCRYYLGKWENEQFTPDSHARMNWDTFRISTLFPAPQFFAPTTLLTPDGRRIMFAWLPGGGNTMWSGTFSLPRELSLPKDNILRIRPIRELECLRYNEVAENSINVKAGTDYRLDKISGDTLELNITIKPNEARRYGARVLCDESNKGLDIFYSTDEKTVSIGDGLLPLPHTRSKPYTVAPFELREGEDLELRIFIDKPVVEAFINDRQAVYRRYPHRPRDVAVSLFSEGGDIEANVTSWKMAASNQW
jgi:sucrose-6-phosphate hydrolase SacC (GH32 family)